MKILIEDLLVPEISDILYKKLNSIYKSAKEDLEKSGFGCKRGFICK